MWGHVSTGAAADRNFQWSQLKFCTLCVSMLQSIKKEVGGTNVILFSFRHSYRMPPVVPLEKERGRGRGGREE